MENREIERRTIEILQRRRRTGKKRRINPKRKRAVGEIEKTISDGSRIGRSHISAEIPRARAVGKIRRRNRRIRTGRESMINTVLDQGRNTLANDPSPQ